MRGTLAIGFLLGVLLLPGWLVAAEAVPTRYAAAGNYGVVYDPGGGVEFAQVSGFALFDYDAIWPHRAPAALRFKVEGNLGATTAPHTRAILSANMLALYFFDGMRSDRFRPYAEAGIGLIYTDFQVEGQGLRLNFNPQAGIGTEIVFGNRVPWLVGLRLHHVSNADLHEDNRGLNSVVLQIGRFF